MLLLFLANACTAMTREFPTREMPKTIKYAVSLSCYKLLNWKPISPLLLLAESLIWKAISMSWSNPKGTFSRLHGKKQVWQNCVFLFTFDHLCKIWTVLTAEVSESCLNNLLLTNLNYYCNFSCLSWLANWIYSSFIKYCIYALCKSRDSKLDNARLFLQSVF